VGQKASLHFNSGGGMVRLVLFWLLSALRYEIWAILAIFSWSQTLDAPVTATLPKKIDSVRLLLSFPSSSLLSPPSPPSLPALLSSLRSLARSHPAQPQLFSHWPSRTPPELCSGWILVKIWRDELYTAKLYSPLLKLGCHGSQFCRNCETAGNSTPHNPTEGCHRLGTPSPTEPKPFMQSWCSLGDVGTWYHQGHSHDCSHVGREGDAPSLWASTSTSHNPNDRGHGGSRSTLMCLVWALSWVALCPHLHEWPLGQGHIAMHPTMAHSMVTYHATTRPRPLPTLTIGVTMVVEAPSCALYGLKVG